MNDNTDNAMDNDSISPDSTRAQLAELLDGLASLDDEKAVDRVHEIVRLADMLAVDWHQLLVEDAPFGAIEGEDDEPDIALVDVAPVDVAPVDGAEPIAASGEDRALLRELLNRVGAGSMTREDLRAIEQDIKDNEFTRMDQRYLVALARRLKVSA